MFRHFGILRHFYSDILNFSDIFIQTFCIFQTFLFRHFAFFRHFIQAFSISDICIQTYILVYADVLYYKHNAINSLCVLTMHLLHLKHPHVVPRQLVVAVTVIVHNVASLFTPVHGFYNTVIPVALALGALPRTRNP